MTADKSIGERESPQVRVPVVLSIALGLLALLTLIAFGLALLFPGRIGIRFVPRHAFPTPAVIPNERGQRMALQARERKALDGAGGRLPIEDAMRQIAARGDHAFDPVGP